MEEFLKRLKEGVFTQMVGGFSEAIPKVLTALIVLLAGRLIASTIRKIIQRILSALQLDKFANQLNDIDLVQRSGMRIELSNLIGQMVYYVIMLGFIIMATDLLGIQVITDMVRSIIGYLPSLLSAFVMFLMGLFLADMVRNVLHTALRSMGMQSAGFISSGVFYFLFITVAVSALAQAKIETGFISSNLTVVIAAIAAAFAIGYGRASRDLVANYLAGYYNRDKVRLGDEVEMLGVRGKVVLIDATSLVLQTDERAIIIPLGKLTTDKIEIIYPKPDEDSKRIESTE
jgi:small-conductance mechanosensitive channel